MRFKVWPSQEAYDLLADLNNGKRTYEGLSDEEKAQIKEPKKAGDPYTLRTNSDTSYTYAEATKSGDTVTVIPDTTSDPGHFDDVDPLLLSTKPLRVKKQWHNNYVDSRTLTDSITMELYGVDPGGETSHDFKTITLTAAGGWYAENNFVSYGLVTYDEATDDGEKIYETGHDFTLRETDDEAHYYELTAGIYRPMYINNVPTILERLDATPAGVGDTKFHYHVGGEGGEDYYWLDGNLYRDTNSDVFLIATNSHRSYLDITKTVTDESGVAAVSGELFEFRVTMTIPGTIDNYATEKYIYAAVYDENGTAVNHLTDIEKTEGFWVPSEIAARDGFSVSYFQRYDTTQRIIVSGETFTMRIRPGWNVRFVNLPNGTTYSIEEVNIPTGYNFVNAAVTGSRWIANMVDGEDKGHSEDMTGLPANSSGVNSDTDITGTIDYANARYKAEYTNRTVTLPVKILKTQQDTHTPLPGAEFALYTKSGYEADPKIASRTGLVSGADGIIDLEKLALGEYYLVETKAPAGYNMLSTPVIIRVSASEVTYDQGGSAFSLSKEGISHDDTTNTYTLTVTNTTGYELPSTGGRGTQPFTLLGGAAMLLAAGALLLKKRRT